MLQGGQGLVAARQGIVKRVAPGPSDPCATEYLVGTYPGTRVCMIVHVQMQGHTKIVCRSTRTDFSPFTKLKFKNLSYEVYELFRVVIILIN
jgi:hypothetical protein